MQQVPNPPALNCFFYSDLNDKYHTENKFVNYVKDLTPFMIDFSSIKKYIYSMGGEDEKIHNSIANHILYC